MKNINAYIAVLTLFTAAACTNEIEQITEPDHNPNFVEMVISAGGEQNNTKLAFDENEYPKIAWKEGDNVSVIGVTTGTNYQFTAQSSGQTTKLKGYVDPNDVNFFAVYPYDANITLSDKYDETITQENKKHNNADLLNVTVPTVQYATPNSFDPNAYVIAAGFTNTDENIELKTACSFLKFRLGKAANVKSVRIEAKQVNTVTITGTSGIIVDYNGKGYPYHGISKTWGPNATYVELVEKAGGHQFTANTDYFVALRASTCPNGITVTVTYDSGETFTKETTKQIFQSPERNQIVNLGIFNYDGTVLDPVLDEVVDFSYAGYNHGESAPEEIIIEKIEDGVYTASNEYTVYDVTEYGAIPDDDISDREAFKKALEAALGNNTRLDDNNWLIFPAKENANTIIYFPEGEYILHTSKDDNKEKNLSESLVIPAGHFIIKGAGRDKTTLVMEDPMLPKDPEKEYSSPQMIQIKHNTGLSDLTNITGDLANKGTFKVQVESTSGISEGSWVCLYLKNQNIDFVNKEIYPYTVPDNWNISSSKNGVEIYDYHQVKSIDGTIIEFYEPLMHEVNPADGWILQKFPHYENVGVEDLTFKGNALEEFYHHGKGSSIPGWQHDGAYKPLSMMRLTNSWIRRVDFVSTSEALSIISSANVSAYDITMSGNRGHSTIRSEASSRVLIAGTEDFSAGGDGCWHGVGVSKHTMGTVLWRNTWGNDSCFESHANQPRATLIDCCKGGWHKGYMGGNYYEAPHHLADLTIWNFEATKTSVTEVFTWWDNSSWNFLPPIIVGFQPASITFDQNQVRFDVLHGDVPHIESLYEYQLKDRLGQVPGWLIELKSKY